jgi:WD40 repeat protein
LFCSAQALAPDAAVATAAAPSSDAAAFPTSPAGHGCRVDSLVALPSGRVASKAGDGRVIVWDVATKAQAATFRVPGCTVGSSRGRLGSTPDGCVLLAGGAAGELHAFDSATGSKLATLTTGKVRV